MLPTIRRFLLTGALADAMLFAVGTVAAALVAEIRDDGGFFNAATITKANDVIKDIHRDFKKDLLIETFKTVPADRLDEFKKMDKQAQRKFFENWAAQRATKADVGGVYVLICKEPGHIEIEVNKATREKAFTLDNRDELVRRILSRFKQASEVKDDEAKKKFYDEGLMDGVNYVYSTMKSNVGIKGAAVDRPAGDRGVGDRNWAPQRRAGGGIMDMFGGIGGLLCVGLIIGLVVWVFIGLIRAFTGGGGGYGGGGPGYGMGGFGGGGGGFMTGLLGGMFGAAAGSWLYDSFFRNSAGSGWGSGSSSAFGGQGGDYSGGSQREDNDYSGSGGDFGGDAGGGGGDAGGGGGDFGGGGGGDFGGGGGGDFGGGGGDFGGGGGDFGGGGGGGDF